MHPRQEKKQKFKRRPTQATCLLPAFLPYPSISAYLYPIGMSMYTQTMMSCIAICLPIYSAFQDNWVDIALNRQPKVLYGGMMRQTKVLYGGMKFWTFSRRQDRPSRQKSANL